MTTDEHLTDLLEHTAGRVDVGPPPVSAMVGAADRVRRRRGVGTVAVVSLLVMVLGGAVLAVHDAHTPRTPVAGEDSAVTDPSADTATVFRAEFSPITLAEVREGECPKLTGIRPEVIQVPSNGDRARHALQALVTDQTPGRSEISAFSRPDGSSYTVRSVRHDGSVITVDLDKDPWDPYPTINMACPPDGEVAMQQIVLTAREALDSDDPVLLTVDGTTARGIWLHSLNGPVAALPDIP